MQRDQLLAWMVMNTMNTSVLVEQLQLGRPLSQVEIEDCYKRTRHSVQRLSDFLEEGPNG